MTADSETSDYVGCSSAQIKAPTTTADLVRFNGEPGIHLTKYHLTDIMRKFLLVVRRVETANKWLVGWMADDNDGFWATNLLNIVAQNILFYVQIEGFQDIPRASLGHPNPD